jgi:hypothetical protein
MSTRNAFLPAPCVTLRGMQFGGPARRGGLMTAAASRQRDFRTAHGVYFRAMDHGTDVCSRPRPLVPYPTHRTDHCVTSSQH